MMFAGAFCNGAKFEIKERSEGRSELSGIEDEPLVCAHLNHDKRCPGYDDPKNGIRVTEVEEYVYHRWHRFEPCNIGLTTEQNDRAIESWEGRLKPLYEATVWKDRVALAHEHWSQWDMKRYHEKKRREGKYIWKNDSYIPPSL